VIARPETAAIALALADHSAVEAVAANRTVDGRSTVELMISSTPRTVTLARKRAGMLWVEITPRLPVDQPCPPDVVTAPR
jgi:hypothetical protein